jgi:hypothetical protein
LDARENLKMADGFFPNEEATQRKVIASIRKYRPRSSSAMPLKTGILIMAEVPSWLKMLHFYQD